MNIKVTKFIAETKQWQEEVKKLRAIILKSKLEEDFKWGLPCYSHSGSNIVIIQPFKACLGLMFFKGSLLKDKKKMLINNGPNSQAARRFEFRSTKEIAGHAAVIKAYLKEAVEIEHSGQKVQFKKKPQAVPVELKKMFTKMPNLKVAFRSLTPGRQRAYLLHFSGAKQAATRQSRIEKLIPRILQGKGIMDR